MKAVRLYGAMDLRVGEVAEPSAPPPGFVNLEVRAAGICGSDLHNYRTGQWISRRPSTAGHEFCGRVTAIGEGVSHVVRHLPGLYERPQQCLRDLGLRRRDL